MYRCLILFTDVLDSALKHIYTKKIENLPCEVVVVIEIVLLLSPEASSLKNRNHPVDTDFAVRSAAKIQLSWERPYEVECNSD